MDQFSHPNVRVEPSGNNPEFPCIVLDWYAPGIITMTPYVIMAADWDTNFIDEVLADVAAIQQLLPEAGQAILYKTGSGYHGLWTSLVKRKDACAILDLLAQPVAWHVYGYEEPVMMGGQGLGYICGGWFTRWMLENEPGHLRVGRKYPGVADITRITMPLPDEPDWIALHDALVDHYNHRGIPWEGVSSRTVVLAGDVLGKDGEDFATIPF